MKVICHTATQLRFQEQLIGVWVLGGFLAGLGLLIFISSEPPIDFFGGACIAIANLMLLWSPVETCHFNKPLNQITLKQRRWLSDRLKQDSIDNIQNVQVEKINIFGIAFYKVSLILTSGKKLYLTQFPSTDLAIQQAIANQIRRFLHH